MAKRLEPALPQTDIRDIQPPNVVRIACRDIGEQVWANSCPMGTLGEIRARIHGCQPQRVACAASLLYGSPLALLALIVL